MLPHPVAANPADVVQFSTNLLIRNSIIAMAADVEEVLTVDMQHWRGCLADIIQSQSGAKGFIEQDVPSHSCC